MPELPEVEVVRRGLERWVVGQRIRAVEVIHSRSVRRGEGLADRLAGRTLASACRRGKFLWLPLDGGDDALVAHLGMSGQLLVHEAVTKDEAHLRVRVSFQESPMELRFVDQRMFGGLHVDALVDQGGEHVPTSVLHIARDPLDPRFDESAFVRAIRSRRSGIKRLLLDQAIVSGIGNIYADESLWRSRLHYDTPGERLAAGRIRDLLSDVRAVMSEALAQGGTSFDSLYVNVNGQSGYFSRSLDAYGRQGEPCRRCGRPLVRERFMNRSSYRCPTCQRRPRAVAVPRSPSGI